MIPTIERVIPIPIIIEPLTVHSELLYINEDVGPTTDLLCNVNIIPSITNTTPIIANVLPVYLKSI
jgi:hypothetical protein